MDEEKAYDVTELVEKLKKYEQLMNWFCDRVEKGEIKSYRTYTVFCKALDRKNKLK